jgi:hypothetical protein
MRALLWRAMVLAGLVWGLPGTAWAGENVYDLSIPVTAETLSTEKGLAKIKEKLVGTMTVNDETGEFTFEVAELGANKKLDDDDLRLVGHGLIGVSAKGVVLGQGEVFANSEDDPFYTGIFIVKGTLKKGKFSGKLYAMVDAFGPLPEGAVFVTGSAKGVLLVP